MWSEGDESEENNNNILQLQVNLVMDLFVNILICSNDLMIIAIGLLF